MTHLISLSDEDMGQLEYTLNEQLESCHEELRRTNHIEDRQQIQHRMRVLEKIQRTISQSKMYETAASPN